MVETYFKLRLSFGPQIQPPSLATSQFHDDPIHTHEIVLWVSGSLNFSLADDSNSSSMFPSLEHVK